MSAIIGDSVETAACLLSSGSLVAIPTETVYGLAAIVTNEEALRMIYKVKSRPMAHPLIMHTHSLEAARPWIDELPKRLEVLAETYWPGPLTLLLPRSRQLSATVTSGLSRVGLRVPAHPVALQLLEAIGVPLAAPSANISGRMSPTSSSQVAAQLGARIPYILEGGTCTYGLESTIIGCEGDRFVLYRRGSISQEELEEALGSALHSSQLPSTEAPGMQSRHYAPSVPLFLGKTEELLRKHPQSSVGLLRFSSLLDGFPVDRQHVLSQEGDLTEAASTLFSKLHKLEEMKISAILAEPVPPIGLGRSINDRLHRAAWTSP